MGKAKKKKFSAPKPCPTGMPSVGEIEANLELTGNIDATPASLQAIVEKLQSPNEETRECACSTIATLVSQPGAIGILMKLGIIKILAPLVLDHGWDVRHRALGALRNLSVDGGVSVCEQMVDKDVLTPLLALMHQFGSEGMFGDDQKQRRKDMICDAYSHAFYLLLYLCENSGVAVTTFNRDDLVPMICSILDSSQFGEQLKLSAAEFLHTVTEDNIALCQPELVDSIHRLMSQTAETSQQGLIRTLATGILVNLEGSKLSTGRGDLVVPIVTSVSKVLSVDVAAMLLTLTSVNGTDTNTERSTDISTDMAAGVDIAKNMTPGGDHADAEVSDVNTAKIKDIENLLKAQKVALEIVTNLCCSEDEEWEDMNSESSSDDATDTHMEEDTMATDNGDVTPLCVSTELHTAYVSAGVVAKVLQAAQPLSTGQSHVIETLTSGKLIGQRFLSKQTHALLCLNNLVSSLDIEALGGVDKLYAVWQGLTQLSTAQNSVSSQELLESVTSAMRAVIQKLAEVDPTKFNAVTPADLQFMYEMSTKCQWSEVRVNALRIVSTIGSILSRNTEPHPMLKDIGVFLLEVVCKDTDLWVVAEALDAIFDVYSEDHIDSVVKEIGLVDKLKVVAPMLKSKINANRKSLGEHYPVISTARTNLVRFIKYKATH